MTQPPLDTLKFHSYGVKNSAAVKEKKLIGLSGGTPSGTSAQKSSLERRYYPVSKDGNYDEWAALLLNQHETATRMQKQADR